MPKRSGNNNDLYDKLRKQIKRYNERTKRIIKKYPELKNLYSETFKFSELKKYIINESDLKRFTRYVNKIFNDEKVKPIHTRSGAVVNKAFKENYQSAVKYFNAVQKKLFMTAWNTPFKGTSHSVLQMGGNVNEYQMITKSSSQFRTSKEAEYMFKSVSFRSFSGYQKSKNEIWKQNFIKSLYDVGNKMYDDFGNIVEFDIVDKIKKISADDLVNFIIFSGEDFHLLLNENYSSIERMKRLTELYNIFKDF